MHTIFATNFGIRGYGTELRRRFLFRWIESIIRDVACWFVADAVGRWSLTSGWKDRYTGSRIGVPLPRTCRLSAATHAEAYPRPRHSGGVYTYPIRLPLGVSPLAAAIDRGPPSFQRRIRPCAMSSRIRSAFTGTPRFRAECIAPSYDGDCVCLCRLPRISGRGMPRIKHALQPIDAFPHSRTKGLMPQVAPGLCHRRRFGIRSQHTGQ